MVQLAVWTSSRSSKLAAARRNLVILSGSNIRLSFAGPAFRPNMRARSRRLPASRATSCGRTCGTRLAFLCLVQPRRSRNPHEHGRSRFPDWDRLRLCGREFLAAQAFGHRCELAGMSWRPLGSVSARRINSDSAHLIAMTLAASKCGESIRLVSPSGAPGSFDARARNRMKLSASATCRGCRPARRHLGLPFVSVSSVTSMPDNMEQATCQKVARIPREIIAGEK